MALTSSLRPAVLLERAALCSIPGESLPEVIVARTTALAVSALKRSGFVCVAVSHDRGLGTGPAAVHAQLALQRRIDDALRGFGGFLDGAHSYPRPGETIDVDVPSPSVFTRLVLEAATKHRIDLARSVFVAQTLDAVEGARIAGVTTVLLGQTEARMVEWLRWPSARPDHVFADFATVRDFVEARRTRSMVHG